MRISGTTLRRSVAACFVVAVLIETAPPTARADRQTVLSQIAQMSRQPRCRDLGQTADRASRRIFERGRTLATLQTKAPQHRAAQFPGARRLHGRESGHRNAARFLLHGKPVSARAHRAAGAGILCPHGHFKPLGRFRADQQIRCAQLARDGATVYSYSMVGWQDSRQTTHDDPHVLALQTWNSLKALDFLSSLDGVDPKRIGMTGVSGGGTQTLYLALLDDRVRASAPVVILYPWSAPEGCCLCEGGFPSCGKPTRTASNSQRPWRRGRN